MRERSDNGFYQCDYCGEEFDTEREMKEHIRDCEERPD